MKFLFILLFIFPLLLLAQSTESESALAQEYFNDQEYAKALEVYQKLYKHKSNESLYMERIIECHIQLKQEKDALDFIDKVIRKNPEEPHWIARKGLILQNSGKTTESRKLWDDLINKKLKDLYGFASVASWFTSVEKWDEAVKVYTQGRKVLQDPTQFAHELANLYSIRKNYTLAINELLNLYFLRNDMAPYVKVQIIKLVNSESNPAIEKALLDAIQKKNLDVNLREILIDFYLESQNFQEALVQTRSLDKVLKENGERVHRLAITFQSNKRYALSNKALEYIIDNHKQSPYYFSAWNEKAINTEMQAMEKKPLDTVEIRKAVRVYEELEKQLGKNISFFNAFMRKANLCIFYLNDIAYGQQTLESLFSLPLNPIQKADVNLLLGDVQLMQGDYNAARLKYTEVEEHFKQDQLGARAKYKSALLFYFKGDFELASARLKTLKENTSNDIANDAIKLNLLIQDNSGLDSTTDALNLFANAQLLAFQNRNEEAFALLDSLLYQFPNHALTDEVLWEKANIYLRLMQIDEAVLFLEKIMKDHPYDILADDALFALAEIEALHRNNPEKAKDLYMRILTEYPGSLFKVEARKRIRSLRGETL